MPRKNESITLSIREGNKAELEAIALTYGQKWGDKANISALLNAIAEGQLKVDWADEAPIENPKKAAIIKAIASIQDGLSQLMRLL